jgi:hypothetical protein
LKTTISYSAGRHAQAESANIAGMSWPMKCIIMVLSNQILCLAIFRNTLFGGGLEGIAILERHF